MKAQKLFLFWLGGWFTWWVIGAKAAVLIGSAVAANNQKGKGAAAPVGYQPVDLQDEQKKAIEGNQTNESSIEGLISRGNAFQADQAKSLIEKTMPGYGALTSSLTNRAQQLADHPYDVPADVTANLQRIAAEKGISAGTRGQFNDFSLLRDLGVNELQYGQQSLSQAQSITGLLSAIAPKVNPMSPLSFYVTPAQAIATTTNNNTQQQAIAQGAANASAAASNQASADLWGNLTKIAGLYARTKTGTKDPEGGAGLF